MLGLLGDVDECLSERAGEWVSECASECASE